MKRVAKEYPSPTNAYSKKVFFSYNDALTTTIPASLLVPYGRVHWGNG
jgi:hypothetical protein